MICKNIYDYFDVNFDNNDTHRLFTEQFVCKLCKSVEFELDLGYHLFKKHGIFNEQYILNNSSVFTNSITIFDFGNYNKIENLYECNVCFCKHITKTLNHVKKHPNNISFKEMNVIKFQCLLCKNFLNDEIVIRHLNLKHNIPEHLFV